MAENLMDHRRGGWTEENKGDFAPLTKDLDNGRDPTAAAVKSNATVTGEMSRTRRLHDDPCVSRRVQAVTSHTAEYMQRWCSEPLWRTQTEQICAQLLVAAGRGYARLPTCERTLRHARAKFHYMSRGYDFSSVLLRALSLFGPGELRVLRVRDADVFRLVLSMMSAGCDALTSLDSLCVVELLTPLTEGSEERYAAALIERRAATIRSLAGRFTGPLLCDAGAREEGQSALARCTLLESLTHAFSYKPAMWLGLSQLHTLNDVDLSQAPIRAIAAALPKLHTLTAFCDVPTDDSVPAEGFFCILLPRLRVFHFRGRWPGGSDERQIDHLPALPLPLLEELVWDPCSSFPIAPRQFLQAQPTVLHAHFRLISKCLSSVRGTVGGPLARVRDLNVLDTSLGDVDAFGVARVLRAAPQLRRFHTFDSLSGNASWLATAFASVVHPWLRELRVAFASTAATARLDSNYALRLRRLHFPRLRELAVDWREFFVTPIDSN
jgi:hypothetical protein